MIFFIFIFHPYWHRVDETRSRLPAWKFNLTVHLLHPCADHQLKCSDPSPGRIYPPPPPPVRIKQWSIRSHPAGTNVAASVNNIRSRAARAALVSLPCFPVAARVKCELRQMTHHHILHQFLIFHYSIYSIPPPYIPYPRNCLNRFDMFLAYFIQQHKIKMMFFSIFATIINLATT